MAEGSWWHSQELRMLVSEGWAHKQLGYSCRVMDTNNQLAHRYVQQAKDSAGNSLLEACNHLQTCNRSTHRLQASTDACMEAGAAVS